MVNPNPLTERSVLPISAKDYAPYGEIVDATLGHDFVLTNQGTAKRYNNLVDVQDLRPAQSKLNLCIFQCTPAKSNPVEISLLEKHPYSTQVFMPTTNERYFLAVVALGGNEPDLSTLKAFLVKSPSGISYRPGVWHHPMIALEKECDFNCLVWEDGTEGDCEVKQLGSKISFRVPRLT